MSWVAPSVIVAVVAIVIGLFRETILGWFYKPDLKFDVKKCEFYNDIPYNQSGINITMFITNRGNKTTTIRSMRVSSIYPEDYMKFTHRHYQFKPLKLEPNDDYPFSGHYLFDKVVFKEEEIKITLEIEYTEDTKFIEVACKKKH